MNAAKHFLFTDLADLDGCTGMRRDCHACWGSAERLPGACHGTQQSVQHTEGFPKCLINNEDLFLMYKL